MHSAADHLALAKRYLKAIEDRSLSGNFLDFFLPDAIIETMPNRLVPKGRRDNLAAARDAAEKGQKILVSETYQVQHEIANGGTVALEVNWSGTLAMPFESIPVGGQMRARFALFLDFKNGKIAAQRNYDCFDPW